MVDLDLLIVVVLVSRKGELRVAKTVLLFPRPKFINKPISFRMQYK